MKPKTKIKNQLAVYQAKSGAIELKADATKETIWATQAQIADIFHIERSVVTKHIRNIIAGKEVLTKSNVQKMHIPNSDKPIAFYSLDIVLAVGYRTNSTKAIEFRKWATKILRQHITLGYTINRSIIATHYNEFMKAIGDIKTLLPANQVVDSASVLELVRLFADTWLSLDAYDKDALEVKGVTKKQTMVTADELALALSQLKQSLMKNRQATELFGTERSSGAIAGIVGNVMQSFAGKPMYPSVEEKAAHLLYFIVKNHPFTDGNKRSGAFAFVWFLQRAKRLDSKRMSPEALTTLTLLIAESNPKDKSKMIGLVCRLLINKSNSTL
ncbi:MAG: RhuM [Candidatus Uhrbacteria bacterium GW2011_GWF2_39_13]|uniref:RhuM n=1 Tax=Candidatus Uhrbacteria bacterium GW2011_GWF2_39_13 TaxID=1618995 RepID=A0A0G0MJ32_9BACT|nr:MAG: RhuM [Candidatus Uhrbacteria bacterium GW2011_GWF2_39_13]HAU66067.1 death-on-curing protein [Candidatus Uhrbacteria bacterium]